MNVVLTGLLSLVDEPPADIDPSTGKGPEWGKAAPIGLLVILLIVIATFFLMRSMVGKINKVPASFDLPAAESGDDPPIVSDNDDPAMLTGPEAEPGSAGLIDKRSG